ncbi:hypothetical protein Poli38472_007445 [Pythium oligandrum]|uniref:2-phosphoglycerate kinase n=1 Tax=Pythium oligandrum TaxID=41045 RepID=A0A8K1CRR8_PYTOL|nr:hypothetical protein Poli38472_007445 [Pythium oligandrum]|eukprot:TMW67773.1 hypothetical protein Poli38472_007445 [Pythium oligandrum]
MDAVEKETDGSNPMELLFVQRHDQRETFTRYRLQETLMLMGCRSRDAVEVTKEVFTIFHKYRIKETAGAAVPPPQSAEDNPKQTLEPTQSFVGPLPVALPWHYLHQCIYSSLARLDYTKPHHLLDFQVAKEITQRNQSFVVLLGGTSGTGKSTLAALLAARLRLTTVLPTDSVRHTMRTFITKEEHPCAFVSTYQAGDALPESVVEELSVDSNGDPMSANRLHKRKILRGYKLQSEVVLEKLDQVLTMFERRKQSLVVEGVHLNTDQMMELVKRHPNCVPFVIYISNELKHRERFAVRARHMTIDPQENKYIKYFENIRIIQRHLCKNADKFLIPKIDNTNVDRSIATIQATLIRVLRKMDRGEKIFDDKINKMVLLSREHENSLKKAWSSKGVRKAMRPLIKQKVAKRLLLRRLLAEQSSAIFGATHPHDGEEDSSSSDEERRHPDFDEEHGHEDDEEDEETTVVGSLFSTTRDAAAAATGPPSSTGANALPRVYLDELEQHVAMDGGSAKMMRSLSAAIQRAALWRASQPLSNFSDWEKFVLPSRTSDATFSEVIESIQADPAFAEMQRKWKTEDRRKSWLGGELGEPTKSSLRAFSHSKSTRDLETSPGLQRHISFAPIETIRKTVSARPIINEENGGTGPATTAATSAPAAAGATSARRSRFEPRRVQSLPLEAFDLAALDYDFDSVSITANDDDDRLSQSSSRRDSCISPLAHSVDDNDSHFEVSSQSSHEGHD